MDAPVNSSGPVLSPLAPSFVGGGWFHGLVPRKRERDAPPVVYRTARCGLRVTRAQRNRLFGLLRSAGDVWCAVLELNRWRRRRQDAPLAAYQELCRELRLDRDVPYPAEQVRSVTLGFDAGRLYLDVTAEVPVATYAEEAGLDPTRVAGVDLGIIHPYAVAGPGGAKLLVSGRAIRAECRQHLRDRKGRSRAATRRAPRPGQQGSRRWRRHKRRQRQVEARHLRRVRQAQHEAAKTVVSWAVEQRVGTLAVGDPRGVLNLEAGRRHNQRTRDWRVGHLISALRDKAEAAGITMQLVDERGTSSTCPGCSRRVPRPPGGTSAARTAGTQGTAT
jgi:IS605 OrfB family transposase